MQVHELFTENNGGVGPIAADAKCTVSAPCNIRFAEVESIYGVEVLLADGVFLLGRNGDTTDAIFRDVADAIFCGLKGPCKVMGFDHMLF